MINKPSRKEQREKRHLRVRKKVYGTNERPRLNVFRSEKHIYAQIIDDDLGNTLVAASSLDKEIKKKIGAGSNKEAAKAVGELVARKALEKGIKKVVFDRSGYIYHGRVKELAEAARQAGLEF
ncbi:MAG: 50S ribosomal protein L18 [Caloramator sp.]|nr:50S ribosomal protein L18 [Caloramator sp.]